MLLDNKEIEFTKLINSANLYLKSKYSLKARMGAEVEFYLRGDEKDIRDTLNSLRDKKKYDLCAEKGWNQYEVALNYTDDLINLAESINKFRFLTNAIARRFDVRAIFDAKPFLDDYGSSIHVHLSLHNITEGNIFAPHTYEENLLLQYVIGGILDLSPESIYFLCENQDDYRRYVKLYRAPTHVSWGGNNRTTVVRIPDSIPIHRRIEFRTPPSTTNPYKLIFFMLLGAIHGLSYRILPGPRIYGNAFDDQYNLIRLPNNVYDAEKAFNKGKKILRYITVFQDLVNKGKK